jgi:hypothetical protein
MAKTHLTKMNRNRLFSLRSTVNQLPNRTYNKILRLDLSVITASLEHRNLRAALHQDAIQCLLSYNNNNEEEPSGIVTLSLIHYGSAQMNMLKDFHILGKTVSNRMKEGNQIIAVSLAKPIGIEMR